MLEKSSRSANRPDSICPEPAIGKEQEQGGCLCPHGREKGAEWQMKGHPYVWTGDVLQED